MHKAIKNNKETHTHTRAGTGIAQRLEHETHDQKVLALSLSTSRSGGIIFFSRVNFLC